MTDPLPLILFHSPNTRSSGTLALLEELQAPYSLKVLNMKTGEQRRPDYLAVNPLGKVPAVLDGEVLVTEQVAIFIHLSDRFPQAGLTPALDDPQRGAWLRWLVFYAACFEPAMTDRSMERPSAPPEQSPYGSYEEVLAVLEAQLLKGQWLLGQRLSSADILWGTALGWMIAFGLVPDAPVFTDYARRIAERPSAITVRELDDRLDAEHASLAARA